MAGPNPIQQPLLQHTFTSPQLQQQSDTKAITTAKVVKAVALTTITAALIGGGIVMGVGATAAITLTVGWVPALLFVAVVSVSLVGLAVQGGVGYMGVKAIRTFVHLKQQKAQLKQQIADYKKNPIFYPSVSNNLKSAINTLPARDNLPTDKDMKLLYKNLSSNTQKNDK